MRVRYRVNIVTNPNATEAVILSQQLNTASLQRTEYERVRGIAGRYKQVQLMGYSTSIKRVGDTTMVVAANGQPGVISSMAMVGHQGPRIQAVTTKYASVSEITGNTVGIDACANVHMIPRTRAGVKVVKYQVLNSDRKGKYRGVATMFPASTATALPAEWTSQTFNSIVDRFYGADAARDQAIPTQLVVQFDSFPIPPLPAVSGSDVVSSNSVTLEFFLNYWFSLYGPDVSN